MVNVVVGGYLSTQYHIYSWIYEYLLVSKTCIVYSSIYIYLLDTEIVLDIQLEIFLDVFLQTSCDLFIYISIGYLSSYLSIYDISRNGLYTYIYIYIHIQSIAHMCVVPYFRRYLSTNLLIIYHDLSIYLLIHLFTMPHIPEHMIDWQSLERT